MPKSRSAKSAGPILKVLRRAGFKSVSQWAGALLSRHAESRTQAGTLRKNRVTITPKIEAKVIRLSKKGVTLKAIAVATGVSIPSVCNIKRRAVVAGVLKP